MKIISQLTTAAVAAAAALSAMSASAAPLLFDQNVTAIIFGSGNPQGGFTVDRDNNIELGLRAKTRFSPNFGSNSNGTYNQATGFTGTAPNLLAPWNFEWSINSNLSGNSGRTLSALTYVLSMDFDADLGTNFRSFDPINGAPCFDNYFGNNSTTEATDSRTVCSGGVGTSGEQADYAAFKSLLNLAQNSWNLGFFDDTTSFVFDPTANGQYTFRLQAFDGQRQLASTTIDVIVGTGAAVPVPATLALAGLGLLGLAATRRRA